MCPCNWPKFAASRARCALLAIAKRIRYIVPCHVTGSWGVTRGKCMWKEGEDQCVTQPFPAGGVGGTVSPPAWPARAEPWRQTHFGNNLLKIDWKSGLWVADPISDVHWLVRRWRQDRQCCQKLGSCAIRVCDYGIFAIPGVLLRWCRTVSAAVPCRAVPCRGMAVTRDGMQLAGGVSTNSAPEYGSKFCEGCQNICVFLIWLVLQGDSSNIAHFY